MKQNPVLDSFRRWGFLQAELDSFGRLNPLPHPELDAHKGKDADKYRSIYCGQIGVEFTHILDQQRVDWIAQKMEEGFAASVSKEEQRRIFRRIVLTEVMERMLHSRYAGVTRFSIEGLVSLIPMLDGIIEEAAEAGFEMVVMGMAHRGRLATLHTIAQSPAWFIFSCFEDIDPRSSFGSGDVKYHRGAVGTYTTSSGKKVTIRLTSNPSHLEAVNPVVVGRVRAKQDRANDTDRKKALAILIHGDAAFAGQGVVAEVLNMADMPGFTIGGTVNIIANNLIGFTAEVNAIHSSRYSTDLARRLPIPIFHVNAENPEAAVRAGRIAMQYRAKFSSEVVIDLIGYRRYGHNEGDDPTFTSPTLYEKIKSHPFLSQQYGKAIGLTDKEIKTLEEEDTAHMTAELEAARVATERPKFFTVPDYWNNYTGGPYNKEYEVETKLSANEVKKIAEGMTAIPKGFNPHPKLGKILEQRMEMSRGEKPFDWGTAEAMAFGSLVTHGIPVRLCGQDSRRGTFGHRHAVFVDYKTGNSYYPLANLKKDQARFEVYDTVLSEAGSVGFEYGYSREYPEALVLWEAQFGDFANGAQVIIDQFVTSGEDKWGLLSGLVLLLPHGYEGRGPEHSSARLERYLELCGEDNIQVAQPSTSGQYFHLLRRQALRKWRKPLIVMTPKSMLRLPASCSPLSVITEGKFQTVLPDEDKFHHAERILLCSGKIIHELRTERAKREEKDTAIIGMEQLYPFPEEELAAELEKYAHMRGITWVQEEPANMGALGYVKPYLEQFADISQINAVRRSASASPATGSGKAHEMEQKSIIKLAFASYR